MSAQDKLLAWQTVIAAITSAVIIIYTVVTWRLQKNAQKQTKLLGDQLELTKGQLKKKDDRERREAEPFIRWRGGSSNCRRSHVNSRTQALRYSISTWFIPRGRIALCLRGRHCYVQSKVRSPSQVLRKICICLSCLRFAIPLDLASATQSILCWRSLLARRKK